MDILKRKTQKYKTNKQNAENPKNLKKTLNNSTSSILLDRKSQNSKSQNSKSYKSNSKNSLSLSPNSKNSMNDFNFHDEDIFDLTKLVSMENEEQIKIEKNLINDEDRVKLLQDYVEVNPDDWDKIPKNIHIRYLRNDGLFRRGGFVKNFWVTTYGNYKGKKCVQLAASMAYRSKKWTVPLNDINKIWKKHNSELNQINDDVEMVKKVTEVENKLEKATETIDYLLQSVEQLKISLKQSQNDQQRIMNLIKQIHKRIPTR
jgi:hypothetical protein